MRYTAITLRTCAILFASVLAFSACNDSPTTIGTNYLPQNIELHTYAMKQSDMEFASGISVVSNSSIQTGMGVLVGRAADGTTAHGLLAITTQSPTLSGATAKPVKSATLVMRAMRYRYGDTASRQLTFDVVVLSEVFSSTAKWSPEFASRIEAAPVLGSFNGTYLDDTTLAVSLDPAATGTFLQEYFKYEKVDGIDEFRTLKTLALRAKSDGRIVGAINGLAGIAAEHRPKLEVVVNTGTADSTVTLGIGSTNWIADRTVDVGTGKIVLEAGLGVRTLIKLKLDSIPTTATVHQAELRLFVDRSRSSIGSIPLTTYLVAYLAADSSTSPSSFLFTGIGGIFPVNRLTDADSNMFRFTTLSPAIGAWLRTMRGADDVRNDGLILAINRGGTGENRETTTVDRLVFHGPDDPNPALRPTLTIYYSLQADAK